MNFFWMILGFLILTGAALLYCRAFGLRMGEGVLLAAVSVIALLFFSGHLGTFAYGMYAMYALAAAGYVWTFAALAGKRIGAADCFAAPSFVILALAFLAMLVLYDGSFIQNIDELHQWALGVKYMLREDALPSGCAVLDHTHPYATGLFHLFFQRIGGYNEGNMYVSSFLLMWIGFLLPFAGYTKKEWKSAALYALVVYISLYTLYVYGSKNINVDVPTAAWAGGLAGWWMNRDKKKSNLLVAAGGLLTLCYFKLATGPLLAVFVLLFMLLHTLFVEKDLLNTPKRKKIFLVCAVLVTLGGCALTSALLQFVQDPENWQILPAAIQARFQGLQVSPEKVSLTTGRLLSCALGRVLGRGNLSMSLVPFLIFLLALMKITADLFGQKKEQFVYMTYSVVTAIGYYVALLLAFLLMFGYSESVTARSCWRYFSVYAIYLFILTLVWLLQRRKAVRPKAPEYLMLGLLVLFAYGINSSYIPVTTGFDSEGLSSNKTLADVKGQIALIQEEITEEDKVYAIDQVGTNEISVGAALYYMEDAVSSYLVTPWKFSAAGGMVWSTVLEHPQLADFPALLTQGGYTYVWIYQSDKYLRSHLPNVLSMENVTGGYLYRVVYENGNAAGLEPVRSLKEEAS